MKYRIWPNGDKYVVSEDDEISVFDTVTEAAIFATQIAECNEIVVMEAGTLDQLIVALS